MLQTSLPSIQMWPAFGLSRPTRCLRNTDLPVPDGPSSTEISPGGQRQGDVLPDRLLAEPLGQVLDPDLDAHAVLLTGYPLAAPTSAAGVLLFSTRSQLMSDAGGRPNLLCGHRLLAVCDRLRGSPNPALLLSSSDNVRTCRQCRAYGNRRRHHARGPGHAGHGARSRLLGARKAATHPGGWMAAW